MALDKTLFADLSGWTKPLPAASKPEAPVSFSLQQAASSKKQAARSKQQAASSKQYVSKVDHDVEHTWAKNHKAEAAKSNFVLPTDSADQGPKSGYVCNEDVMLFPNRLVF